MEFRERVTRTLTFRRDIRHATAVAAISEGTAQRLERHCGRRADAIVRPGTSMRRPPADRIAAARERYAPGAERLLLAVGTRQPRKNHAALAAATAGIPGVTLAIAGARGWKEPAVTGDHVRLLGRVPDDDLPALYAAADVLVQPSLYEGFGMPLLEARACGTRTVATDMPEHREAAGPDAIYCEPSPEGLRDGVLRGLDAPLPTAPLPDWADWEAGAAELLRVLERAASSSP
jgi:glycosyltransferase involved in cell wall biosynthesis